jgi:hypothetical protein
MAAQFETCTKEEQCSVITFLTSEGVKPMETHCRIKAKYGDGCVQVELKFTNGVTSVKDAPHPGQAHRIVMLEGIAAAEALIRENRRVIAGLK